MFISLNTILIFYLYIYILILNSLYQILNNKPEKSIIIRFKNEYECSSISERIPVYQGTVEVDSMKPVL